ncbi:conserved unknown protein [Ectocarpus siliculosus]|uniref:Uncharacterized protein n=1 Tax=Ectocarpus siliculosus TaxID=2880 RepID=D7FX30_ECTSI|nr:conserved unknown protein [Ectocarpus siliculosus]|eukprot:CBJ26363.1 conserved unknown protein [Ectocarpus siliculosus]
MAPQLSAPGPIPASGGGQPAGGRLMLGVLEHRRFSTAMWSMLMLLSFIMVVHNLVFRSWGIGTFPSITRRIEALGEQGTFSRSSPLIDAEGKPSILAYARTPAGRVMHILPAGLWSVIAPLQLSPSFRAKHRTAHRRLGRLFIFMSVSISLGLVPLVLSGAPTTPNWSNGRESLVFAGYFLVTGLLAVHHARNKRFADHRVWMLRHVAMGYSVHMQRLLGHLTWWMFPLLMPGYTDFTNGGKELRANVFISYFFVGLALTVGPMEVWLRHTSPSGKDVARGARTRALHQGLVTYHTLTAHVCAATMAVKTVPSYSSQWPNESSPSDENPTIPRFSLACEYSAVI